MPTIIPILTEVIVTINTPRASTIEITHGTIGRTGAPGVAGAAGEDGVGFVLDVVDILSNKTNYDGEIKGFSFLASDTSDLYINDGAGGWSVGIPFGKGDPGAEGITRTLTASPGNDFVAGSVGFISDTGTVTLSDAAAETTAYGFMVMATEPVLGDNSGIFAVIGEVVVTAHGFTLGVPLFLRTTAGLLNENQPISPGEIIRVVAYALNVNSLYFHGDSTYVEI